MEKVGKINFFQLDFYLEEGMKLNMKMIFIVNESAGRGKSKKIIPNIEKECKNQNIEFEIRYITKG